MTSRAILTLRGAHACCVEQRGVFDAKLLEFLVD